jgi:hypothetical protein
MFQKTKIRKKQKNESGVSLIFTVLFLGMVLSIGLGIANLMLKEIKISSNIGYSVPAYYAAEAGIEKVLYIDRKEGEDLENYEKDENLAGTGSIFHVEVTQTSPEIIIKSVGTYNKVKRGVQVSY